RIVAGVLASAAWVSRNAACLERIDRVSRLVPIGGPLPDVADHVVDAVRVGRKRTHRRRPFVPVGHEIRPGELALPRVGHVTIVWKQLISPGEWRAIETTSSRTFPLGFGRKRLAFP